MRNIALATLAAAASLFADGASSGHGPNKQPLMAQGLEVDENVNRSIDLNLSFLAEDGSERKLSEYFGKGRPVVLNLVYYACPSLCNMVLNGQTQAMKALETWTPGNEYDVVTISIDPRETPNDAAEKRKTYEKAFGRPAPGWHFLADTKGHAKMLATQMGYKYRFDEGRNQYVHPAAIMVLSPEGKIARYLYGTRFTSFNLKMAITEAREGKGRFSLEKALLLCYQYDPNAKGYVVLAENLMRGGALVSVLVLGAMLWRFWLWEKKRAKQHPSAFSSQPAAR
ncbi:photosynthetic protein synthase I [Bryobacterales bacterium F-183]|nr:photosynthetic protein synthase I [Bryobacterales bacterium F-183]